MDGELIASFAGESIVIDTQGRELIASFVADYSLSSCNISEDGSKLIAGDKAGNVHILHLEGYDKGIDENSTLLKGWKKYMKRLFVF
jgi:hypothetical protein